MSSSDSDHSRAWRARSCDRLLDRTTIGWPRVSNSRSGPKYWPPLATGVGGRPQRRQRAHRRALREAREPFAHETEPRHVAGDVGVGPAGCAASDRVVGAGGDEAALQFVGEQQVGQLRAGVGGDAVVAALGADVVEVESEGRPVPEAPDRHHPRVGRGQHPVEQQSGQREVAEVVGPELQLEAVGGELTIREEDAGVVDEHVDPIVRASQRVPASRIDASDARSSRCNSSRASGTVDRIWSTAAAPRSGLRTASTTVAPWAASCRAVSRPSPEFAPVTIATRPVWSGMSASLHTPSWFIVLFPSARRPTRQLAGPNRRQLTAQVRTATQPGWPTIVAASAIRWSFDHGGPNLARGPCSTSSARPPRMRAASASTVLAS